MINNRFIDPKLSALHAYTPGFQPEDKAKYIKLNTNESPFPPSENVIKAIEDYNYGALRLYPDNSLSELKQAIAEFEKVTPECVTAANGSDELLAFCFHGLCPNGAAFADETYGFYSVFCDMFSVKAAVVPLKADFSVCLEDYDKTKGTVFIANPNAPTGIYLKAEEIAAFVRRSKERLFVIDEAYIDFGGESMVRYIKELDNLIVIRTFSKSRSLAGMRLGYAIANEGLISVIECLRNSFNPYNINALSLKAGAAAMRDAQYFEATRAEIINNREKLKSELESIGFYITESKSNFLFAKPPCNIGGREYMLALESKNILVRHFDRERTRDFVRITVGSEAECKALLKATEDIIKDKAQG